MKPLVSILIPTYNRPYYFKQALKSALNQAYSNIEIIVCDNSDNDKTEQIVNRFLSGPNGSKIKYKRNSTNIGPIANQQQCLDLAKGEYINYLMDDDLFHPNKLEAMMEYFLKYSNLALVTSQRRVIDAEGQPIYVPPVWTFKKLFAEDTVIQGRKLAEMMLRDSTNYIGEPTTALFKRSKLKEPFGVLLGKQVYFAVDLASWLNLLEEGDAVYMTKPLSYLRYHAKQLSKHELADKAKKIDKETFKRFARKKGYLKE